MVDPLTTAENITQAGVGFQEPGLDRYWDNEPDPYGTFGAMGQHITSAGIITGFSKAAMRDGIDFYDRPDGWSIDEYFERNPDQWKIAEPFFNNPEMPMADVLFRDLGTAYNDSMVNATIQEIRRVQEDARAFNDAPFGSIMGQLGGIGADLAASLVLMPKSFFLRTGLRMNRMANTMAYMTHAYKAVGNPRYLAAFRTGMYGAAEGSLEALAQGLTDPDFGPEDIAFGGTIGLIAGGALGTAFPFAVGGMPRALKYDGQIKPGVRGEAVVREAAELSMTSKHGGAARLGEELEHAGEQILETTAEAIEAQRLREQSQRVIAHPSGDPLIQFGTGGAFRNPLNVLRIFGARGRRGLERGEEGASKFYDAMVRLIRPTTTQTHELEGAPAVFSARDHHRLLESRLQARNFAVDQAYNKMLQDVFGLAPGWLGRIARAYQNSEIRGAISRQLEKRINSDIAAGNLITLNDFMYLADNIARVTEFNERVLEAGIRGVKNLPNRIDISQAIPPHLRERLTDPDVLDKLVEHAKKISADDDKFFDDLQKELVQYGLLDAEDVISHYRTRLWHPHRVASNRAALHAAFLDKVYRRSPEQAWVNRSFPVFKEAGVDPKTGQKLPDVIDTETPRWAPDETFEEFTARMVKEDPELLDDILDEWGDVIREALIEKGEQQIIRARHAVEKATSEEWKEITAKWDADYVRAQKSADTATRLLNAGESSYKGKKPWPERREQLMRQQGNARQRMHQIQEARAAARKQMDEAPDGFAKLIAKKFGRPAASRIREKQAGLRRAISRTEKRQMAKTINQQVDALLTKLASTGPDLRLGDLKADEFGIGGSRLMKRMIDLGEHVMDPVFLNAQITDPLVLRGAYIRNVGMRLAMRKAFKPLFQREGVDFSDSDIGDRTQFQELALRGYHDDISKARAAGDIKKADKIRKEMKKAETLMRRYLDEFEGVKQRGKDDMVAVGEQLALSGTAIASLGSMVIAQMGDLAVTAMAGSNVATGFRSLLRQNVVKKTWEAMQADDEMLAALMYGANVLDNSRFRGMVGTDFDDMMTPGSHLETSYRIMEEVGHAQSIANMSQLWNVWVRRTFGFDIMRQIRKDMGVWDNLSPRQKEFYHRQGISSHDAKAMHELFEAGHVKRFGPNDLVQVPDREAWSKLRPDLLERYEMLVQRAGDEALLSPQMGDLPFMRYNMPFFGPIILQFTGFMFTAGERMIPRMIQSMRLRGGDVQTYTAVFMGLIFGGMVDLIKNLYYGKSYESWENQPTPDMIWGAAVRSPFLAGMSSSLLDVLFMQMGTGINQALDAQVVPQAPSRFHQMQGPLAIAGAFWGQSWGMGMAIRDYQYDGDGEKFWRRVQRILPIWNTVGIQTAVSALQEE